MCSPLSPVFNLPFSESQPSLDAGSKQEVISVYGFAELGFGEYGMAYCVWSRAIYERRIVK